MDWFTPEKFFANEREKNLRKNVYERVSEGLAGKTWDRHRTVWRAINEFSVYVGKPLTWPLDPRTVIDFASWCNKRRHLQASTIKTYVQGLSKIQQMKGGPPISIGKIPLLKNFIAGVENVQRAEQKKQKKAMSYPLLQIIGDMLGKTKRRRLSKNFDFGQCVCGVFSDLSG